MCDNFDNEEEHVFANFNTIKREFPASQIFDTLSCSDQKIAPSLLTKFYPIKDQSKFDSKTKEWSNQILASLSTCVLNNELWPGFYAWNEKLVSYIQEFGFTFSKEEIRHLLNMYIKILVKYPKNAKNQKATAMTDAEANSPGNNRPLKITINNDFRAIIVIGQTITNILIPPKFALKADEFTLTKELTFELLELLKYLKYDNVLVKLFDTDHGYDLHSTACTVLISTIRSLARFVPTEVFDEFLTTKIEYLIKAQDKGMVMPYYEVTVWYVELLAQFSHKKGVHSGKSKYLHKNIFPILWANFPEYKVLDDRTIYLLDRYLHLVIDQLDDTESLKIMDVILSSLIVRMKLPVGKSSKDAFSTTSITSSEISNFGSYLVGEGFFF